MKISPRTSQSGFALLIFLVVLMGTGGLLLTGFSQGVLKQTQKSKIEHNKRVLMEAKQALLQFAYNYPLTNGNGPGRLPCPDTNNNGTPNTPINCSDFVGRLPWNQPNLNLHDIRDAAGQRLWYAVSSNFSTQEAANLNSNTFGTITIRDPSGSVLYDGSDTTPGSGIAAVIIAPGPVTSRNGVAQDRSVVDDDPFDTVPDDDPGVVNATNYLDQLVGIEDNADIVQSSANNGFIFSSPNDNSTDALNDQMIVITAAEVIEMAEKATLQAYRDALRDYQQNAWGGVIANYRYPWLDHYDNTAVLTTYDADFATVQSDPVAGRVPSMFRNYFNGPGPVSVTIDSQLVLDFQYDGVTWTETTPVADVFFDAAGDLVTDSTYSSPSTTTFYLWDGHQTLTDPNSPNDGTWELCTGTAGTGAGGTGDEEDDCNRKTDGTFKTPADSNPNESEVWLEVKRIEVEFNPGAANITFPNGNLKGDPLSYSAPAFFVHSLVTANYNNNAGYLDITNEIDRNFQNGFDIEETGPAFGVDPADKIGVGIRYYPELPDWALGDQWHDSIMFTYSAAMKPDGDGTCTQPIFPFDATTNLTLDYCLVLENSGGVITDKIALLILAGDNTGLVDDGPVAAAFFAEELEDIFEGENGTPAIRHDDPFGFWVDYYNPAPPPADFVLLETNLKFDYRPANNTGNDLVLVLD